MAEDDKYTSSYGKTRIRPDNIVRLSDRLERQPKTKLLHQIGRRVLDAVESLLHPEQPPEKAADDETEEIG